MPPSGFPSEYERFGFTAEVLNKPLPISPFSDQRCHIAESHKHARTRQILLHAAIKSLAQLACKTALLNIDNRRTASVRSLSSFSQRGNRLDR